MTGLLSKGGLLNCCTHEKDRLPLPEHYREIHLEINISASNST
jgi:hypothetical protein